MGPIRSATPAPLQGMLPSQSNCQFSIANSRGRRSAVWVGRAVPASARVVGAVGVPPMGIEVG
eukprot:6664179-Lingulodinium_polyedra.AAC.1